MVFVLSLTVGATKAASSEGQYRYKDDQKYTKNTDYCDM